MVASGGTANILPIADRSLARAIPLQNAYSDRVDQYDTISVHTGISSQNGQSVQNGAISPRIPLFSSRLVDFAQHLKEVSEILKLKQQNYCENV